MRKRQRTGAVQKLAQLPTGLDFAKRLGLRQPSAAFPLDRPSSFHSLVTSNSLPRSSITFTAMVLFGPAGNGALVVPARCAQTLSSNSARDSRFKLSHAPVRGKKAWHTRNTVRCSLCAAKKKSSGTQTQRHACCTGKGLGKSGAGDGNRTRIASLEGWHSTIELHPQQTRTV